MGVTEGSIFSGVEPLASPLSQFIIQVLLILAFTRLIAWVLRPIRQPTVIAEVLLILAFTRLIAWVLRPIRQPTVIAEVIAGILLGPSALGRIPGFKDTIFPEASISRLQLFANIALLLFMFTVGLELDFQVVTKNLRKSISISVVGIVLPFGLGAAVAVLMDKLLGSGQSGYISFVLFGGTAMSITAFPVLARILSEMRLLGTRVGSTTMNAAAVDDIIAWTILALVIAISRAAAPISALWTILSTLGFLVAMAFVVRPLLTVLVNRLARKWGPSTNEVTIPSWAFILIIMLCFLSAYTTEVLGVHAIFGAFVCGVIVPRTRQFHVHVGHKIEDLVVSIFLPLYFTFSGLRTQFNAVNDGQAWGLTILVISAAVLGKLGGCTVAARLTGMSWRESLTTGTFMNAKGLVELIVLNVGLDLGVLSPLVFSIFVFMALITTFMTVPLIYLIYPPHRIREDERLALAASQPERVEAHIIAGLEAPYSKALAIGSDARNMVHLLTLGAAVLPRDAKSDEKDLQLCQFLPVTDRLSTFLQDMTDTAVRARASDMTRASGDASSPPPGENPLLDDMLSALAIERARALGQGVFNSLTLCQWRGQQLGPILQEELGTSEHQIVLLSTRVDPVSPTWNESFLSLAAGSLLEKDGANLEPNLGSTTFLFALDQGCPLVAMPSRVERVCLVLKAADLDSGLLDKLGRSYLRNRLSVSVFIVQDAVNSGLGSPASASETALTKSALNLLRPDQEDPSHAPDMHIVCPAELVEALRDNMQSQPVDAIVVSLPRAMTVLSGALMETQQLSQAPTPARLRAQSSRHSMRATSDAAGVQQQVSPPLLSLLAGVFPNVLLCAYVGSEAQLSGALQTGADVHKPQTEKDIAVDVSTEPQTASPADIVMTD